MVTDGTGHAGADVSSEALQRAARELLPVLVDLGPTRALLETYVEHAEGGLGAGRIVLSPIAADAIPERTRALVRARGPEGWTLRVEALIVRDDRTVEVDLASARQVEMDSTVAAASTAWAPHHGMLVLVVPGGMDDASSYVFPVRAVTRDACEIETTAPMPPGTSLPVVELVGDRRILRQARGQVLSVVPRVTARGREVFRCELSLRAVPPEEGRPYDLVTDAREVRRLLDFAGMTRAAGWYEAPGWGRGQLVFCEVSRDEALVELEGSLGSGVPPASLRIGTDLFAVSYELEVRALGRDGTRLRCSLPLILRRRRRHGRERTVAVPADEGVRISFVNPLDGSIQSRTVSELSPFAVGFDAELGDAFFWRGLPLERGQLSWRDRLVELGDVEVTSLPGEGGEGRCTVAITDSRLSDDGTLIELLATAAHPQVSVHRGHNFDALIDVYKEAGLFAPHMDRNLEPLESSVADVWRRLHGEARDVVCTLTHGEPEQPDGAVTVMRAWESAWVAQHFVDVSRDLTGATGKLQRAYLDHLLPRPDGRFLVFFVKSDNHVMTAYMRRFFASVGTPEAASQTTLDFWGHGGQEESPGCAAVACDAGPEERTMVGRAAERCLGRDSAMALSMAARELELPDTSARFARAGLERARPCRLIEHEGEVTHVLLEERTTPGVNLTWMLNATWVLPVHRGDRGGAALRRALADVLARPAQAPTGERFVNAPAGLDRDVLRGVGFEHIASVEMFVLNRAGVHQFFQYATRRYGELDARAERRQRRSRGG